MKLPIELDVKSLIINYIWYLRAGCYTIVVFLAGCLAAAAQPVISDPAVKTAAEFEKMPRVTVPERPFLFVNRQEIAYARNRAEKEEWAKKLKADYIKVAEEWIKRDYNFIKIVIPPWGSIYTYGLGLDLDPIEQKRMKWRGWKDPRHVEATNGIIYPNAAHPDKGQGWTDPQSRKKYYFIALANGMTTRQLVNIDLPALVNSYLFTGNEIYAERALWILDAIAAIYPRAYEGPIDYPHNEPGKPDGGRLERAYYQTAAAMVDYAYFTEILSMSSHSGKASLSTPGYSMLKNIELNILMNGADYCMRMAKAGKGASYELNNGNIDYNRAPLIVGALLGITDWVKWALDGPLGYKNVLANTIDINGRYFESSTTYASHTRELLLNTAHFLNRMRLPAYPQGYKVYDDNRFAQFALEFFTGIQAAGRLPLFGDAGPDTLINRSGRVFDAGTLMAAHHFYRYSAKNEIREAALQTGAYMLKNIPANYTPDEEDLFHLYGWEEFTRNASSSASITSSPRSSLFFDYGTLVLRSGEKEKERAALVRFGPTLNHGHADELGLAFYAKGRDFSADPGHYNTHLRFGFTTTTVAHNLLVVNRRNQLWQPSSGGDLQTWTDGSVLRSVAIDDPQAYAAENIKKYKRRVALIDISPDESYIIDNFWALGGRDYDYSLHGVMRGELQVLPLSNAVLKETRSGSVMNPDVDHSANLNANYRVTTYPDAPFYFAPPGAGYGFLSNPSFYSLNGPVQLQWSATDNTGHRMYVSHFAPPSAQLITARSPKPPRLDATYALSRVSVPVSDPVRFTSVIMPTAGENKLASVHQLLPSNSSPSAFALRITPAATIQTQVKEHIYMASDRQIENVSFEGGLSFSGEEGFLGINALGKAVSVSLTGAGFIQKGDFKFTVRPLFEHPLRILEIENEPLRILVNAPYEQTRHLENAIIRLNKSVLARPFVLRVNKSEAAGRNSWLQLDASTNVHAIGTVEKYDPENHSIVTGASFPHTRPYIYNYDEKTGVGATTSGIESYNGGYNGFWLVNDQNEAQKSVIKTMEDKRTRIVLDPGIKAAFKPGDSFEIRLLGVGDVVEVPVWGQAELDSNNTWQFSGPAVSSLTQ